jgi:hypothetical protein
MTDILLGAADLYNWKHVKPWAVSARESGFDGEIWLILYRDNGDVQTEAEKFGINVYKVEHDSYMAPIIHSQNGSPTQAHNLRFYHAWELLTRLDIENYRWGLMTDVRDVVFQRNPFEYIDITCENYQVLAASEGIKFKNEPWNKNNLIQGYGQNFYDLNNCDEWVAYNVGVLAGDIRVLRHLFHMIFSMTEGRYYPSDQSSWNVLVEGILLIGHILPIAHDYVGWACQCGTTADPTKAYLWPHVMGACPTFRDGVAYTGNGNPRKYYILHQWDRVPELKTAIEKKYDL